jgi:hypothetical protein
MLFLRCSIKAILAAKNDNSIEATIVQEYKNEASLAYAQSWARLFIINQNEKL